MNRALRVGLDAIEHPRDRARYVPTTYSMGHPRGFDLDKALAVAAALENEEIVRKLQLRK